MFLVLVKRGEAANLRPKRRGEGKKRKKKGKNRGKKGEKRGKKGKKGNWFQRRQRDRGSARAGAAPLGTTRTGLNSVGLTDQLQKLMQCIYILDTLYLFKVTYVIYLDTIVCHLRNAFFLSLSLFVFNFIY